MVTSPEWQIECRESNYLTTIDGFLISYRRRCSVTLKSTLSAMQKEAVAVQLLNQLTATEGERHIQLYVGSPPSPARTADEIARAAVMPACENLRTT